MRIKTYTLRLRVFGAWNDHAQIAAENVRDAWAAAVNLGHVIFVERPGASRSFVTYQLRNGSRVSVRAIMQENDTQKSLDV